MRTRIAGDVILELVGKRPKEFDDQTLLRIHLVGDLRQFADQAISEYNKTTKYWKANRPVFTRTINTKMGKNKDMVEVTIYADNPIYPMIDNGTPAHNIPIPEKSFQIGSGSKEAKTMAQGTWGVFHPGSMPGTLSVKPKGSTGKQHIKGQYLSLNQHGGNIAHPGIAARDFTGQISDKLTEGDKLQKKFQKTINDYKFFKGKETEYG